MYFRKKPTFNIYLTVHLIRIYSVFVDKDDLEGHKFLIETSVAASYNKVDTILKDTTLSHSFTSDLMIFSKR
ncbi:hypothetical protein HK099_000232 [Clydaea vesicula]|uniref:Uncharacterized protein n=1 Tax=Clydaea vesicula TaxID=447962 RepID=A0AAD5U7L3_9FUNG|nr:hypothetical protein HK099_000232 [Clydaea vesicula]